MKIPSSFQLGGITWTVSQQEQLPNMYGACNPQKAVVVLDKNLDKQIKEQTFCHELVHSILFGMGKPMPHDEEFVDGFGILLHQYLNNNK